MKDIPEPSETSKVNLDEFLALQYAALAERRLGWDQMLNQVPSTALTGLAFLLFITLDSDSSPLVRVLGASLSLLVSITALSSLGRFRHSEITDAEMLEELELKLSNSFRQEGMELQGIFGNSWRDARKRVIGKQIADAKLISLNKLAAVLGARRAFGFWVSVFSATSFVSILIIVLSILRPTAL